MRMAKTRGYTDWLPGQDDEMLMLVRQQVLNGNTTHQSFAIVAKELRRTLSSIRNRYYVLTGKNNKAKATAEKPEQLQYFHQQENIITEEAIAITNDTPAAIHDDVESVIDFIKESFGRLKKLEANDEYAHALKEENGILKGEIQNLKDQIIMLKDQLAMTSSAATELAEIKPTYELLLKIMNDTRSKVTGEAVGAGAGPFKFKADRNGNLERVI